MTSSYLIPRHDDLCMADLWDNVQQLLSAKTLYHFTLCEGHSICNTGSSKYGRLRTPALGEATSVD